MYHTYLITVVVSLGDLQSRAAFGTECRLKNINKGNVNFSHSN